MLTAQEVYAAARTLPLPERLRLAALILDEVTQPAHLTPDPQTYLATVMSGPKRIGKSLRRIARAGPTLGRPMMTIFSPRWKNWNV